MTYNKLTLKFTGEWAFLEPKFTRSYFKESIVGIRWVIVVVTLFYGVFGILDAILIPEKKYIFWAIRYLIVIPSGFLVFCYSFSNKFEKYAQLCLFTLCFIGGAGIEIMVALAGPPTSYSYYAGIILVLITIHTFFRMQFLWACACSWSIVVCYEIIAVFIVDTPSAILINNNFFIISATILCMLAGYSLELSSRRHFIATHLLDLEKENVARANQDLDQRVKTRTLELTRANQQLHTEMQERKEEETERRKLEKELNKMQKMEAIGTLAGGIAHDFNNILSAIIGHAELALEDIDEADRESHYLNEILKAGNRAKNLTRQILTFSRQTEQDSAPLELKPIIDEALKLIRASIPSSIEMKIKLNSNAWINGDPTEIHRIIMNICTNAVQAMKNQTGILGVALEDTFIDDGFPGQKERNETGSFVMLTISDTGGGIPNDVMDKIFDPFFTTKPVDHGSGMGLSVVHGIVRQYGGTIKAYSEPDQGTTFTILLPTVEKEPGKIEKINAELPRGSEHILVLDDESAVADITGKNLNSLGYQVSVFTDADQALDFIKTSVDNLDLVITDQTMPKITGLQFAEILTQIRPDTPIILCTGYSEHLNRPKMKPAGIRAFLMKPIIKHRLATIVRNILDQ